MIEAVNGSLTEWEKSHDVLVYNSLNQNHTSVNFIYYPQLPGMAEHLMDIKEALTYLVKMSGQLRNNSDTVLVIGRYTSIDKKDFPVLMSTLKHLGLTGIRIIRKTKGCDNCEKNATASAILNDDITAEAKRYGFEILQTFPIIMSRYKDVTYSSTCALHYHTIEKVSHTMERNVTTIKNDRQTSQQHDMYHVYGDVMAAYSNMLISMLHGHWSKNGDVMNIP
ncbi:unnamed protein product [Owenia fusiformis]|uniref:Uncharacterized protein n=1 Tax=Owenia fusiformis TaxID=6347 RepID=A0A8S4N039_OWEFU|nr:unnamed protein product [Owenia fusiformis]